MFPWIAQAAPASSDPTWLQGLIEVPFPLVAALVGAGVTGALVFYARRAAKPAADRLSAQEERLRQGP